MTWTAPTVLRLDPPYLADERRRLRSDGADVDDLHHSPDAHMIDEYARHHGHADLIRELIDGATGR